MGKISREETELNPELFTYELYDSGWRYRFDVSWSERVTPKIAEKYVGWCDASRLLVRPRRDEYAVMCEDEDGKFWFHVPPGALECIVGGI